MRLLRAELAGISDSTAWQPAGVAARLADTLAWEGENPYRIIPPSQVEQLAIEGRLPHMMKRWRAVSAVGLFIWAVVPVSCMVAFVLFT